ncbi:MAG TPA: glycosyltransferase family 4 protein [Pyrinomonadaceae bacterium]|nr:glycosyltransferase family 4 protein [Pyrinomonadaceae bacterium]
MKSLCFIVESGTDVRLVDGLGDRYKLSILARRIEAGVEISQTPKQTPELTIGPASRLKFAVSVWKHLRACRNQTDRVIVQGYGLAALAANVAGRINRIPTAMLVCSPVEDYYRCRKKFPDKDKPFRSWNWLLLKMLARINAKLGRQYIVLSEHLAQVVRRHGSHRSVAIIPLYGVDTTVFVPTSQTKTAVRFSAGLPVTGSLIFFSSRIAPEKDSETMLRALRILVDKGLDARLIHRSGGYQNFLQQAEQLGVAEHVIATDAVHPHEQLPADYQASDVCVQASRAEGLGFSPLEALACEVPVIASAVGGLKETIRDGETGWSYPVGDHVALANAIEQALDNPDEASRRAQSGRAMVIRKYDARIAFDQLDEMKWVGESAGDAERLDLETPVALKREV